MKHKYKEHASYLRRVFEEPENVCQEVCHTLDGVDFDSFVVMGTSGMIIVDRISRAMGKPFAVVRKEGDGSHSYTPIEGTVGQKWVFLDDFVSSGETFMRVCKQIAKFVKGTECVGIAEHSVSGRRARWVSRARFDDPDFFANCYAIKAGDIPDGIDRTPPAPGAPEFIGPMYDPWRAYGNKWGSKDQLTAYAALEAGLTATEAMIASQPMRTRSLGLDLASDWWTNKVTLTSKTKLDEAKEQAGRSLPKLQVRGKTEKTYPRNFTFFGPRRYRKFDLRQEI